MEISYRLVSLLSSFTFLYSLYASCLLSFRLSSPSSCIYPLSFLLLDFIFSFSNSLSLSPFLISLSFSPNRPHFPLLYLYLPPPHHRLPHIIISLISSSPSYHHLPHIIISLMSSSPTSSSLSLSSCHSFCILSLSFFPSSWCRIVGNMIPLLVRTLTLLSRDCNLSLVAPRYIVCDLSHLLFSLPSPFSLLPPSSFFSYPLAFSPIPLLSSSSLLLFLFSIPLLS